MHSVRKYFDFVRFEHTVFALPFALASMAVAAQSNRGWPRGLKPLATEAFRRRGAGTITDNELYPYQAAKARIISERKPAGLNV